MSKPFKGLKVYYSGTMKGAPEPDPDLPWNLVRYMVKNGANVLSEHVAARNEKEKIKLMARHSGVSVAKLKEDLEPWFSVRRQDLLWVDESDCVVALVNAPSLGVGMEIQHAILKPDAGKNVTPVLCLVRSEVLQRLSFMVRGITSEENPGFEIKKYSATEQAQQYIFDFLSRIKTDIGLSRTQ